MRDPGAVMRSVAEFLGLDPREALNALNAELSYDAKARARGQEVSFVPAEPRPASRFRPTIEDALARAWSPPLPGELA